MELLKTPAIAVAVICATVSYALMNLVMTSSPLAVVGCGFHDQDAANVVTAHVLAMYAPVVLYRASHRALWRGAVVALACDPGRRGAVALTGVELEQFFWR
jgi:hypothetical protein